MVSISLRHSIGAFAAAAALLLPLSSALADEKDDTLKQLNESAVGAMHSGDFEGALKYLDSALKLGENNMTWLNMGRAMQRLGRCDESLVAYAKVRHAPAVVQPPKEEVERVLVVWQDETEHACSARIALTCEPGDMKVSIDGRAAVPCPVDAFRVEPGTHRLVGEVAGLETEEVVVVEADATAEVALVVTVGKSDPDPDPDKDPDLTPDPIPVPVADEFGTLGMVGSVVAAVGAITLTVGLIVDATIVATDLDEYRDAAANDPAKVPELRGPLEDSQNLTLGLVFGGAGLLAVGTTLLIIELVDSPESTGTTVGLAPSSEGFALTLQGHF